MITREEIISYIKQKYQANPEYTFAKYPNYCAFKNTKGKWFCLLMDLTVDKLGQQGDNVVDIINVKVNPELNDILKQKKGFYTAYHMNKKHWLSINLHEVDELKLVTDLIDDSYELTM